MAGRLKEKDPWDVYFCVKNFPGGPEALVAEYSPYLGNSLVREGLRHIAEKFSSGHRAAGIRTSAGCAS